MPSSKDNPLMRASAIASAIAMHEASLLHNRKIEIPNAILPVKCFRDECNEQRVKGKLFCSVSCSKLHDEMQRAEYHGRHKLFDIRNEPVAEIVKSSDKGLTEISL